MANIDLSSFDSFMSHTWLSDGLHNRFKHDVPLAASAVYQIIEDLENLNNEFKDRERRVLFTSLEGRVKEEEKFFKKLYSMSIKHGSQHGINQRQLDLLYNNITDLAGVRFANPYYDEVEMAVQKQVRPWLKNLGYAVSISKYKDKNYLDDGDSLGYRSYHFFVRVPVTCDIWGKAQHYVCEIQARSELQHVWADKSHNLLYKPQEGWHVNDDIKNDMKQVSDSLRTADHFLASIRQRVMNS